MQGSYNQADNRPTILIAEDSPTQALHLQGLLEDHGYAVTVANNGRAALELAKTLRPTLIISDIVMPEMDGYGLCRAVKGDPVLQHTPVVLVTDLSTPDDVIKGLECCADNFITKPYDEKFLLSRLTYVLKNQDGHELDEMPRPLEIEVGMRRHSITAKRGQILGLLISVYQEAVYLTEELKSRQRQLEAANSELEAFSYSVSHDLRAPLRHIESFSHFLEERISPALDNESRGLLGKIHDSVKRMSTLIEDLLAFSQSARTELRVTRVLLDQLVREVVDSVRTGVEDRDIAWSIHPLPAVQADPSLLRQALINLVGNAVKYTRNQPQASIQIGCDQGSPQEIVLFIRDNGAGFDMRYAHKLFGVFQRLHSASEFEGTGVGLANVQRIVHRHGGRVWAEGEVGKGATFFIALPA